MRACMVCGVPTDGRTACVHCAKKLWRLGDIASIIDRARSKSGEFAFKVNPVVSRLLQETGAVKLRKRTRPPKPPRAVLPVCDESECVDECTEIDTRRFRNLEQGGV